ncbi:MAG: amidohydrolase [Myxococcales bacterium]
MISTSACKQRFGYAALNSRVLGVFLGLALSVACTASNDHAAVRNTADVIFFGGTILTMDEAQPTAEAVAIQEGRIVSVGRRVDVMKTHGRETELVDLNGGALLPGFHNAHVHPALAAVAEGWEEISGFKNPTAEATWAALAKAVQKHPPGEWVFAYGWDPILVKGLGTPTLEQLDEIAPVNPLFVTPQGGHQAFLNSRALAEAGITGDTPDPGHGAYYERDAGGALTGRLVEQPAFFPVQQKYGMPQSSRGWRESMQRVFRRHAEMGVTSVTTMGIMIPTKEVFDIYRDLTEAEPLIRHNVFLTWYARDQLENLKVDEGHSLFRVKGMKIWYDGSPYSATMLLEDPYVDNEFTRAALGINAGARGHANWKGDELFVAMQEAHRDGWQIAVHTQGDRALRETLQVMERVASQSSLVDRRHRFEHLMLAEPALFERLAQAGISASFHIQHIHYYGQVLRDSILGAERAERMLPLRSAMLAGTRPSLHSDHPMFSSTPMELVQTAVTRSTREGDQLGANETVSIAEALRAMTLNPAWQVHEEDRTGSIAVGKLADLVLLSTNPLEARPDELGQINVDQTWVGGILVWDRKCDSNCDRTAGATY